jgi:HEAT repeat protein
MIRLALVGAAAVGIAGSALLIRQSLRAPDEQNAREDPTEIPTLAPMAAQPSPAEPLNPQVTVLVDQVVQRWQPGRPAAPDDQEQLASLEASLLAMGPQAVPVLLARLDDRSLPDSVRQGLLNVLRRLPGPAVEQRLVQEARFGTSEPMRTMAFDALAERKSDQAIEALATVARSDPQLPVTPLIAQPRDPNDTGTELPDEQTFTPRMQAMAALARTRAPRAVDLLLDVVRTGPDESLRMEAARHLGEFADDRRVLEVLTSVVVTDPSAYVRLAALHSLRGARSPVVPPVLTQVAAQDRDAGVRTLAGQVLAELTR